MKRSVRLALQRPRDQLPRAQGLRARRRGAVGRRAAHGALRPRRGRRDVHDRHRVAASRTWCSSPPATAWARRWCRARSTRTSSTSTSRCSSAASSPIIRRNLGSKLIQMEFAPPRQQGRPAASWCKTVDAPIEQRNRYSLTDAEVVELAQLRASIIEKHYGRPMDIEWGKDGGDGQLYILQARPETVKSQQKRQGRAALQAQGHAAPCWPRAARSARRSAPGRCAWCTASPRWTACSRRRARHRHDRSELGAGDEARRGHRHQPRRAHLPRGDHRARAGHSGGGRLRRRDRDC